MSSRTLHALGLLLPCVITVVVLGMSSRNICAAEEESKTTTASEMSTLEANLMRPNALAESENLIWSSGFEEGCFQFLNGGRPTDNQGPLWAQAQFQNPDDAAAFVTDIVRSGQKAVRFEWQKSGMTKTNTSRKAMIHFAKAPTTEGTQRWYGFSFYIPKGEFIVEPDYNALIFQLHATPDFNLKEPWRIPPVALSIKDGIVKLSYHYDLDQVSPKNDNIKKNIKVHEVYKLPDMWDHWTDFVLQIRLSLKGEGLVRLWVNGKQVVNDEHVTVGYNDAIGPYPSWGIYSYNSISERRVVYLDEVRIGDEKSDYDKVAPGRADQSQKPRVDMTATAK